MKWYLNSAGNYQYEEFDPEKVHQVDPCRFMAFGVTVESRSGKVGEICMMLTFLEILAHTEPETLRVMESVFYDSSGCVASIKLKKSKVPRHSKSFCKRLSEKYFERAETTLVIEAEDEGSVYHFYDSDYFLKKQREGECQPKEE